jgi:peptidoglycan/xylan/chitin deacetylase (PgdA/CDA1 family)
VRAAGRGLTGPAPAAAGVAAVDGAAPPIAGSGAETRNRRDRPPMPEPPPFAPVLPGRWTPAPIVRASCWLHAAAALGLAAHPPAWPWAIGAVAASHAAMGVAGLLPRNRLLGPNLSRLPDGARRRGEVALTFDDGPDPEVTPRVLDLLEAHGAAASFFLIGRRAARYAPLVRELVRRGHSAENHTHRHLWGFAALPLGAMRREIAAAQDAIADAAGGEAPRFFRPPAGLRSPLLDPNLAAAGLLHVSWTRRGYDTVRRDPDALLRRLGRGLAAGDVLLLHDGNAARAQGSGMPVVLEVLPELLRRIADAGLRAVSLPRAMPLGGTAGDGGAGAGRETGASHPARAARASR